MSEKRANKGVIKQFLEVVLPRRIRNYYFLEAPFPSLFLDLAKIPEFL